MENSSLQESSADSVVNNGDVGIPRSHDIVKIKFGEIWVYAKNIGVDKGTPKEDEEISTQVQEDEYQNQDRPIQDEDQCENEDDENWVCKNIGVDKETPKEDEEISTQVQEDEYQNQDRPIEEDEDHQCENEEVEVSEIKVSNDKIAPLGVVQVILNERVVIIDGREEHNRLNHGTLLWMTESRTPLGLVVDIFENRRNPSYVVRLNSIPEGLQKGTQISFITTVLNPCSHQPHPPKILPPLSNPKLQGPKIVPIGAVQSVFENLVIIDGNEDHDRLDKNHIILVAESGTPLGLVDKIFVAFKVTLYIVRFDSEDEIPKGVKEGTLVSVIPVNPRHLPQILPNPNQFPSARIQRPVLPIDPVFKGSQPNLMAIGIWYIKIRPFGFRMQIQPAYDQYEHQDQDQCESEDDESCYVDAEEPIGTINEELVEIKIMDQVPEIKVKVESHYTLVPFGVVDRISEDRVIIEGAEKDIHLNIGVMLWITKTKTPLGLVQDFFETWATPLCVVRLNSMFEVPEGLELGTQISFITENPGRQQTHQPIILLPPLTNPNKFSSLNMLRPKTVPIGVIQYVFENLVIIDGNEEHNRLDKNQIILITVSGTPLGLVDQVFATDGYTSYVVRFDSDDEIPKGVEEGTLVSVTPVNPSNHQPQILPCLTNPYQSPSARIQRPAWRLLKSIQMIFSKRLSFDERRPISYLTRNMVQNIKSRPFGFCIH